MISPKITLLIGALLQLYVCFSFTFTFASIAASSFCDAAETSSPPAVSYWSTRQASPSYGRRYFFPAIMDSSDRIFVIGGFHGALTYSNDVWLLQPNDWDAEGGAKWTCQTCGDDVVNATRFERRSDHSAGVTTDIINAATGFPRLFVFGGERWLNSSYSSYQPFHDLWSSDDLGRTWTQHPSYAPFSVNAPQAQYNQRLGELFAITTYGLYSINATNPVTWYSRDSYPFSTNFWQSRYDVGVTQIPGFAGDKWIIAGGYYALYDRYYNDVYIVDLSLCVKSSIGGARYTMLTSAATWTGRQNHLVSSLSPLGEPMLWMYGPSMSANNSGDFLWFSSNASSAIGQNWVRVDNVTVNAAGDPCQGGWPFPAQMKYFYDSFVFLDSRSRLILLTDNNQLPGESSPMNDTRHAIMILNTTNTNAPGNLTRWNSCSPIQNTTLSSTGAGISSMSSSGTTGSSSSSSSSSTVTTGSSGSSSSSSSISNSSSGGSISGGTGVFSSTAILGSSSSTGGSSSSISGDSAAVAGSTGAGSATGTTVLPVDTTASGSSGLSSGAVAAIVVGGLVGLLLLMAAFARVFAVRRVNSNSSSGQSGNSGMHQLQEMQHL